MKNKSDYSDVCGYEIPAPDGTDDQWFSWGGSVELKATFVNKPLLKALVKESKRRKEQANERTRESEYERYFSPKPLRKRRH